MRLVLIASLTVALNAAEPGDMVRIPAGEFTMGRTKSTPDDKTQMRPKVVLDDRPVRKVQVSAFSMDAFEVTHEQYAKFAGATKRTVPYHWVSGKGVAGKVPPDHATIPVFNVSWQDANDYCKWQNKRLPTEAEWEKAARGGLDDMDYPLGNKLDEKAARYSSPNGPSQVGKFPPNSYGLFDMAGNVAEWCSDWFDREHYAKNENVDPQGPPTGLYKIIRGGAWSDAAKGLKVYFRNWVRPEQRTPNIGFRCVI